MPIPELLIKKCIYVKARKPEDDGLYGTLFNLNTTADLNSVRLGDIIQVTTSAGQYAHTVIVTNILGDTSLSIDNRIRITWTYNR